MKLIDIADVNKLKQFLSEQSPKVVLHQWAETAFEIYKSDRFSNVKQIYAEMEDWQLDSERLMLYIENLIDIFPNDSEEIILVRTMARHCCYN